MKILLDSSTPVAIHRYLSGHTVTRTKLLGWQDLANGVLLDTAEQAGLDLLLTCDQSIPYQQNFTGRKIAVLVLSSNNWNTIRPVAAKIAITVDFMQPGSVVRFDVKAQ